MTVRSPDAIAAALAILRDPHLARLAQSSPLPKGMTFLLEVAAGDGDALAAAHASTGRSQATLQKASGFFIEQVLLSRSGDNYRVLGASRDAPNAGLRRHMALILKWLHPDLFQGASEGKGFNRSAYVNLVTEAWETLKTSERRTAYDVALDQKLSSKKSLRGSGKKVAPLTDRDAAGARASMPRGQVRGQRRLVLYRIERDTLWSRLLSYFGILR